MREAVQSSNSLSHSVSNETTKRLSEGISGSFEESNHFRQEAMKSYRASEDYQRQAAHTKAFATSINANYNQEFVDWLANQRADNTGGSLGKQGAGHIIANEPAIRMMYAERFLAEKGINPNASTALSHYGNSGEALKQSYESDKSGELYSVNRDSLNRVLQQSEKKGIHWDRDKVASLHNDVASQQLEVNNSIEQNQSGLSLYYQQANVEFHKQKDKLVLGQALKASSQHFTQPFSTVDPNQSGFIPKNKEGSDGINGENQNKS